MQTELVPVIQYCYSSISPRSVSHTSGALCSYFALPLELHLHLRYVTVLCSCLKSGKPSLCLFVIGASWLARALFILNLKIRRLTTKIQVMKTTARLHKSMHWAGRLLGQTNGRPHGSTHGQKGCGPPKMYMYVHVSTIYCAVSNFICTCMYM